MNLKKNLSLTILALLCAMYSCQSEEVVYDRCVYVRLDKEKRPFCASCYQGRVNLTTGCIKDERVLYGGASYTEVTRGDYVYIPEISFCPPDYYRNNAKNECVPMTETKK